MGDKFSYVIVEDIAAPNAFDEAVQGVDAVAHTASPFHASYLRFLKSPISSNQIDGQFNSLNPEDYYHPAIQGTINALKASAKA